MGRPRQLARLLPVYARLAWWGLVQPRGFEREPLVVVQAVIRGEQGILLSVRSDLHGWELPGGNPDPGEAAEDALRREVREETGYEIAVDRLVGEYRRTGFRPHLARVFAARAIGGTRTPSRETPRVEWFPPDALPGTLFPWYRGPIEDALADFHQPVERTEHNGLGAIAKGFWIDLRMRLSNDGAG